MKVTFEIGDVVKLNSAEFYMTVNKIYEDGIVECVWFNHRWTELCRGAFKPEMLIHKSVDCGSTIEIGDGIIITNAESTA